MNEKNTPIDSMCIWKGLSHCRGDEYAAIFTVLAIKCKGLFLWKIPIANLSRLL